MMVHTALFPIAVVLFLTPLVAVGVVSLRRAQRVAAGGSFEHLLRRLVLVDRSKIAQVAGDLLPEVHEGAGGELESWQVWELIGGMDGLETLAANCVVLIDLACYVQRWYPEALPVAEQLRLNAREIQWHLDRLKGAEQRGHLQAVFPDYAQRAVATYYTMTQHVLDLYEVSQVPGGAQRRAAL